MLNRQEILNLLEELGQRLAQRGLRGEMFLVGGAAMALAYNERRLTVDLDAIFEPKAIIYGLAEEMAEERGVDSGWLNDAVKSFLPGSDPAAVVALDRPGLVVRVASPEYLFALKATAGRLGRDEDDLTALFDLCGFNSVDQALDLVAGFFPSGAILPRVEFLLRQLFDL
jgi:predicted nucleotidyltransferase